MNPWDAPRVGDVSEEISALITTLHDAQQRLEVLTEGEVDTVADRDGRTFLLRRAQEHLRHSEAAKQAAILNALPAHIALLDARGSIVSVNETWRKFPAGEAIEGPGHAVGLNYPDICESGWGDDAADCRRVAEGIRSVLSGAALSFEIEYSSHTATRQRWFLMTVTPLLADRPNGVVVMHQDVTARKRDEAELRRFASAMDATADAIYLVDRSSMRFVHVNDAACRMQGRTRDELVALGPEGVLSIPRAELERTYDSIIASGVDAEPLEMLRRRPDGTQVWVELRRHALHSEDGWTIATLVRDVTERKQAQQSIMREKNFINAMLDNLPGLFYLINDKGRFIRWNKEFESVSGYSSDEVARLNPTDLFADPEKQIVADAIRQVFVTGEAEIEADFKAKDQTGTPYLFSGRRVQFDQAPHLIGMGIDVSARNQALRDLHESEERFRSLTKLSSDWFWEQDEEHRFRSFSGGDNVEGWGPDQDKAVGLHRWDLGGVIPISASWEEHRAILDSHKPFRNFEYQRILGDGRPQYVAASGEPLFDAGGRFAGYRGVATEITKRKEAEIRIRRLNRVYAVLSGINALIVRVQDRDELFREACRIAIEAGEFKMAWIGVIDQKTLDGKVVAWHGGEESYLDIVRLTAREGTPHSDRPGSRALRLMQPVISNDVATDPYVHPIREELLRRGHRSAGCFPLTVAGRREGVLCLFAGEAGVFDEAETRLLAELAGDISLALEHIEKAQKLERMTRVNAMLSGINAAIVRIRTRQELFEEACRVAVEIGGMPCAWMGRANSSGKRLKLVASTGCDEGFLQLIRDRLALRNAAPEAQGLSTRAFLDGRVVVVNDVTADPVINRRKAFSDRGIRAVAVFPLFVAGRVAGTFALHSEQAGFFDDDEMRLLNEVAANIAFALEHIEKEEKVRRLTRVYAVLSGINTLIVHTRDRDELFREACRIAVEVGQFAKAWLGTIDPVSKDFTMVAAHGGDPLFFRSLEKEVAARLREGRGLARRAIDTGLPVIVNDAASDPEVLLKDDAMASGVRSLAILPLTVKGEVVAVFALNADVVDYFDDEEMKLLVELAGDIGFALDHLGKQAKLDYLAYYDALTGLANRTLFLERVAQHMRSAVAGGHKLALFYLDLERFRNINDSLGRPAGDALLKQVSEWLALNVGDQNLLARLGGDHFGIVLPEVAQDDDVAQLLDKRIRAFVDHPFLLNDTEIRVATRVGAAIFPNDGTDAETLLHNAETALKKAKAGGERHVFYQQRMTDQMAGKLSLESQLRRALDKEEFVLHYQPKVSLESGKLTSAEALIRWNDPQAGLVPPGKFIPILEETGLIYDVGRWALRKAIAEYLRWRAAGLPAVRIAVNVSPLQLRNRGFSTEIQQVVGIDPLAAAGLELEITESVIMEDVKSSIASLQGIRAMGVTIAIDDFGTGFSSLSHLARLPIDTLKIDRSFVIDMTADAKGLSLVSTIINLAHSLKLKVVAEGVETEEQSRLLRLLRCDEMQGFLFSKPVAAEVFEARFLAHPPAA